MGEAEREGDKFNGGHPPISTTLLATRQKCLHFRRATTIWPGGDRDRNQSHSGALLT